jgi:hypothetical protein
MNHYVFLSLLALPALLFARTEQRGVEKPLVLTHVTVIDTTGAPAEPDMTIIISAGRITALGKAGTIEAPDNAEVVDAIGKFLIPGLWDMHVHWYDKTYLPLFTANGVTGVRQMAGAAIHLSWRKELAEGMLLGPRMVLAGRIVDGPKPFWPNSITVETEEQGRQAVRTTKEEGFEFVKVYSLLPRDGYFGIASEARQQGIPFAGHLPHSVRVAEASDAGQKSVEHLTGVLLGCSSQEEELRREMLEKHKPGEFNADLVRYANQKMLDSYDESKAAALFARFVRNGTWQVPTLTVGRSLAHLDVGEFINDPRLKYMPPSLRKRWNPASDLRFQKVTPEAYADRKVLFVKQMELVGAMRRAGVEILAGTDVLNPYCFPGFSLHDELELLVKAGLTPTEALQTATRNPARYLDQEKDFGSVGIGKVADLVLLEGNPLLDITNTQKIAAVVVEGKLLTREMLNKMLDDVEAAASRE